MDKLVIKKDKKEQLSEQQIAFNKLTERIEKLKLQIEKKRLQLDDAVGLYSTEVIPLRLGYAQRYRSTLEVLYPLYKNNSIKVSKNDFKELLRYYLQEYFSASQQEPDELIKEIFFAIEGVSFDKVRQQEEAEMNEEMQRMFDAMNVDVDLKNGGLTQEEIYAKVHEAKQKLREQEELQQQQREERKQQKGKAKTKSAKQLAQEKLKQEAEQLKQKNVSSIYKQLVKLFHPDLEQDEDLKVEKEVLMKELTAAYETKNLHALLMLELKWIHKETDHLQQLTDEKLEIYNTLLREQATELDRERYALAQHPKYAILYEAYGYDVSAKPLQFVKDDIKQSQSGLKMLENDLWELQSPNAQKQVKKMLKDFREGTGQFKDDDFWGAMMDDFFR